jgi:hypothetical protein
MQRNPRFARRTLLAAAVAVLGVGCAHTPTASTPAPAADQATMTGSRVAQPVDPVTGRPTSPSPLRVYSSDDLATTGRTDVGSAVKELDPAASGRP